MVCNVSVGDLNLMQVTEFCKEQLREVQPVGLVKGFTEFSHKLVEPHMPRGKLINFAVLGCNLILFEACQRA
ncbi:hypothetical protein FQZ97_1053160 [compost metagenome]